MACQNIHQYLVIILKAEVEMNFKEYKRSMEPWVVWLSGVSTGLQTKGLLVQFPVRAHAWVVGQVSSRGCSSRNHTLVFLSLSFSLPSSL